MRIFPERLRRKVYLNRGVISLIRLTYVVVLAQAISYTVGSCRNLNSPVGPLDTTSSIAQVQDNVEAVIVGEVAGYDVGGGNFVTEFSAQVLENVTAKPKDEPSRFRSGGRRPGRTVHVHGSFGRIDLSEDPGNPGTYSATRSGYAPSTYTLTVIHGQGQVSRVNVSAPGIHTITSHAPFDTVTAGQPLQVTWTRAVAAGEVFVETRDFATNGAKADNGKLTIPPSGNPPRDDQYIRVWRINRQAVTRGSMKAEFVAKIRNSAEPIIAR